MDQQGSFAFLPLELVVVSKFKLKLYLSSQPLNVSYLCLPSVQPSLCGAYMRQGGRGLKKDQENEETG